MASEFVTGVVGPEALSGRYWVVNSRTTEAFGQRLLSLKGSDRVFKADGSIDKFGAYRQWFNAFHAEFSSTEEKKLWKELEKRGRKAAGAGLVRESRTRQGRK